MPLYSFTQREKPAVEIAGMALGAPTLDPSKSHTCHVTLRNPTEKDWTFDVSLMLSGPVEWSRDSGSAVCPAGGTHTYDVNVPSGMEGGTYDILIGVYCEETSEWLMQAQDTGQDVAFKKPVQPNVSFVSLSWD